MLFFSAFPLFLWLFRDSAAAAPTDRPSVPPSLSPPTFSFSCHLPVNTNRRRRLRKMPRIFNRNIPRKMSCEIWRNFVFYFPTPTSILKRSKAFGETLFCAIERMYVRGAQNIFSFFFFFRGWHLGNEEEERGPKIEWLSPSLLFRFFSVLVIPWPYNITWLNKPLSLTDWRRT